jgi:hypothetical protein
MRITVLTQLAKGLLLPSELSATLAAELQRLKWFLWHGNVFRSLQTVDDIATDLEDEDTGGQQDRDRLDKLAKAVREFGGYLAANASAIPNYGERYRAGEIISTSFVESAVNQVISKRMVKKQQMRWSPRGAHLLLQIRTRVLNDTLADDYRRWYPDFTHTPPGRSKPRSLPRFVPLSVPGAQPVLDHQRVQQRTQVGLRQHPRGRLEAGTPGPAAGAARRYPHRVHTFGGFAQGR